MAPFAGLVRLGVPGVLGDTIPFAGVYARQVRDLRLSNVRIAVVREEPRPAIICDDVRELSVTGLRLSAAFSAPEPIRLQAVQKATVLP